MAKLRREIIEPKSGGGGGKGEGFDVARTGDARIGFVGFPSVGKSTLLSNLAGVYSEVAAYEFTTLTTVPGVIRYKDAVFLGSRGHLCGLALNISKNLVAIQGLV